MPDSEPISRGHTLILAVVCEGVLAVIALALGLLISRPPLTQIHWTADAALWGVVATLPLFGLLLVMMHVPWRPLREFKTLVIETLLPMFRESRLIDLAIIALLAGIGEEMLFRGVVQEAISFRFGPVVGLVVASLGFGLAHPLNRTYVILVSVIGLYLGGLWLLTDNLLPPIIAHALYDFVALVYLLRTKPGE